MSMTVLPLAAHIYHAWYQVHHLSRLASPGRAPPCVTAGSASLVPALAGHDDAPCMYRDMLKAMLRVRSASQRRNDAPRARQSLAGGLRARATGPPHGEPSATHSCHSLKHACRWAEVTADGVLPKRLQVWRS